MGRNDRDKLLDLDWSKVYADVPGEVRDGIRIAQLRIRQHEQRKRRTIRWIACAACLTLAVGAVAFVLQSGQRAPDRVIPLAPEVTRLDDDAEVYASREDARFHLRSDCPRLEGEAVSLKLVTAVEFEKSLCPECGANTVTGGT